MLDYWNSLSDVEKVGNAAILVLCILFGAWTLRKVFKG